MCPNMNYMFQYCWRRGNILSCVEQTSLLKNSVLYFRQKSKMAESEFNVAEEFKRLTDLIQGNTYPGDFSCLGVCPVVPEIHFKDSLTFEFLDPSFTEGKKNNLNRTAISIQDLIGLCSQAPFGRNEETVVDKTVRSCWQLDPEKFIISNSSDWNNAFDEMKTAASIVLAPGLDSDNAELRLYKLLVYEKGSFFLPHRDTQKDENHFGTVVLSLPVKHKGGELFVRHNGQERIYNLDPGQSISSCQWAAFYTDVEHEIKEITSGHRITLIYHLYSPKDSKLVAPVAGALEHPIVQSLNKIQEFLAKDDDEKYKEYYNAGYLMEHKYTPMSLQPKNLKGRDAFLYQILSEAKFKLKLSAIDVRVNGRGGDNDARSCCLADVDLIYRYGTVEFSELDLAAVTAKESRWYFTVPSRPMDNVHWLIHDITKHAHSLEEVDSRIKGTGNEGCCWHTTYITSALVVQLCKDPEQGTKRKFSKEHTQRDYPSCEYLCEVAPDGPAYARDYGDVQLQVDMQ